MTTERRILLFCSNPQGQVSHLRGGMAKVRWDRAVRAIPEGSAHDLVRLGDGFLYALTFHQAAERFNVDAADLHAMSSELTLAEFRPLLGMRIDDAEFENVPQLLGRVQTEGALEHDDLADLLPDFDRDSAVAVIVLDPKTTKALRALSNPKPATNTPAEG